MRKKFKLNLTFLITISAVSGAVSGAVITAAVLFLTQSNNLETKYFFPSWRPNSSSTPLATGQQIIPASPTAQAEEQRTTDVVKLVSQTVVSIMVSKDVPQYQQFFDPNDFFNSDSPFEFFFGGNQVPKKQATPPKTEKQQVGGGTGFIISEDGLVVTNKHVVADLEADYTVILSNGKKYPAKVLDRDPLNDVAVIKIEAQGLPSVKFGNSDEIKVGQTVIAIGNSLAQYSNSVTKGIVSGLGRKVVAGDQAGSSEVLENVIQTDAAINPGNSGGPLINLSGEVIGINTAMNQSGQLIGFALPINSVKKAVDSVRKSGKIVRAYLGVRYSMITPELVTKNNLKIKQGAIILKGQTQNDLAVLPGSPADKAGLQENDIILSINNQALDDNHALFGEISKYSPGQVIIMKISRAGSEREVKVTLEEYKTK